MTTWDVITYGFLAVACILVIVGCIVLIDSWLYGKRD